MRIVEQEAEWIADGDCPLAHDEVVRVAECDGGQVVALDLDESQVVDRRGGHELGRKLTAVGQRDLDLVGAFGHVVVGDHHARGIDDEARAQRRQALAILHLRIEAVEELVGEEVVERILAHHARLHDRHRDHGRARALGGGDDGAAPRVVDGGAGLGGCGLGRHRSQREQKEKCDAPGRAHGSTPRMPAPGQSACAPSGSDAGA
jgi:hypothetical protein